MAVSPSDLPLAEQLAGFCRLTEQGLALAEAGDWDAMLDCIALRDEAEPVLLAAWHEAAPVAEPLRRQLSDAYGKSQRLETLMRLRQVDIEGQMSVGRQQQRINRAYFR